MPMLCFKITKCPWYNQNSIILSMLFLKDIWQTQFWHAISFTLQIWTREVSEGSKTLHSKSEDLVIQQKCSKITLWFSHLYDLSARRLILLFPFLWLWTALAFPIRCPLVYRLESGRVSLSHYLSVVNLFLNLFVAAALIISAGSLDFDVAFCWLGCLALECWA